MGSSAHPRRHQDVRAHGMMAGDGEPALVQVQLEIVDERSAGWVPQNLLSCDPQANGASEASKSS